MKNVQGFNYTKYLPWDERFIEPGFTENRIILNPEDYSKWVASGFVGKFEAAGVMVIACTSIEKGRMVTTGPIAKYLKDSMK